MKKDMSFAGLFGNEPTARILEYLILGRDFKYSMTDIHRGAKVSKPTTYKIIRRLRKQKLVIISGKINSSTLYSINKKSEQAKVLISAFKKLLKIKIETIA